MVAVARSNMLLLRTGFNILSIEMGMIALREDEMNQPLISAVAWIEEYFGTFGDNWRFEPQYSHDGLRAVGFTLMVTEEIYAFYKLRWT